MVDSLFTISVEGTAQLEKVLASIKKVKMVQGVKRVKG
jgi:hypothetical protein